MCYICDLVFLQFITSHHNSLKSWVVSTKPSLIALVSDVSTFMIYTGPCSRGVLPIMT